jgi:phage terminase large subunit-like protein
MFSLAVIGLLGSIPKDTFYVYLLDYYIEHLRAALQEPKVLQYYDKWKPLRTGIEVNQYQDILRQTLKTKRPSMVVVPVNTKLDKLTRAQKRSPLFEAKRVFFRDSGVHARPIDYLVRFPNGKGSKDFWDSLDNALRAALRRVKGKSKRKKFGVL